MMQQLKKLAKTVSAFGLLTGTSFIINKKINNVKNIKLSLSQINIKYPVFLRPNTSDDEVLMQIFMDKEYDIHLDFVPKIIIDGGANIGLASVYFKNKFPEAKLFPLSQMMKI